MSLRFGVLWPFRNPAHARVPWDQLYRSHLDLIVDSERMGYDDAWLTEHHFVDDGYSPSLHAIAGAVAARTTRIRIGTFVLLLPLHDPVKVAEDTATVDLISNGRFDLGVGLGYRPGEFVSVGKSPKTRGKRLQEGTEIIQRLLAGEKLTFDGEFTQLREVEIVPPPLQQPHPPIWLAARAPKAIERAARFGYHFMAVGPVEHQQQYDDQLRKYGRDPRQFSIAQLRAVFVAPSRAQAWEQAAEGLHYMANRYAQWFAEARDMEGDDAAYGKLPSVDEIIAKQAFDFFGQPAIVGTPEDAIQQIQAYQARGRLTHLVMAMALPGVKPHLIRDSMELFAKTVMPHFRQP
jgi:alkanesulfonate monooxygenase SsuD/methylene tetrahydromethanopterin reductase-like flavin-dependent oxidoreductase (luciferase family)